MRYDGVIFDLDGTLWDSSDGVCVSWLKTLADVPDLPRALTMEDAKACMGMTAEQIMERLFPGLAPARQRALFDACMRAECAYLAEHGGRLYPGVPETLEALGRALPLFVVSNCEPGYLEAFFRAHDAGKYFTDYEYIGRTGLPKSENIRLVAERNGLTRPVYVGDTVWDREAARAANVPFVFCAYGFGNVENVPTVRSFPELLPLLTADETGKETEHENRNAL